MTGRVTARIEAGRTAAYKGLAITERNMVDRGLVKGSPNT